MSNLGWICGTCGQRHDELPLCFGADEPALWWVISDEERARSELTKSACVIQASDETAFFVRGHIEIPVAGLDEPFTWGVWASLSESNFIRTQELWNTEGREKEPPYFGWLSTNLQVFPDTMYLKTMVQTSPVGSVPIITVEPTEHPLAVAQHQGVTLDVVRSWVEKMLHG